MKKFFIFFISLLAAFILANIFYILILSKIDFQFKKTKEVSAFKNQQFKVLIFGNSTAYDGINAELITKYIGPAYNFSLEGASLESNYEQLKSYLRENEKPERLLLFLSSTHINYFSELDGDTHPIIHPIIDHYYSDTFDLANFQDLPLFKFRWLFFGNLKKIFSKEHRSAHLVDGQLRINRVMQDNTVYKQQTKTCFDNNFYGSGAYAGMWKIIDVCKKEGIEIKIFEMPCWEEGQNNCSDITISKNNNNNNEAVPVYNLNNNNRCNGVINPKTDWLSKNHLNYNGSVKVTNQVIQLLSVKK